VRRWSYLSINQEAIRLLEENDYEESFRLFKKAVEESRSVQSLNNLAWIYCYEEYEDDKAIPLLMEALSLNPSSYFPYNLMGEIYLRKEKWSNAKDVLQKSINIQPSINAYYNLAVAHFNTGDLNEAAKYFRLASGNSDDSMYSYVYCLTKLGETKQAKELLDKFCFDDDEFVGEVFVAELYLDLGLFYEAVGWFEKAWKIYWKTPDWISRYIFSLIQLDKIDYAKEKLQAAIQEKVEEIREENEEECDEHWTGLEKQEHIKKLNYEKIEYEQVIPKILNGFIPDMDLDTSIKTGCYLFGCNRHNYPEYNEIEI
jgi:tetratricopeptide (TPR) repeat protein